MAPNVEVVSTEIVPIGKSIIWEERIVWTMLEETGVC